MKKIVWISVAGVLAVHPVNAQQQEIILKVTNQQLELIGKGLGKLPFDDVALLIQNLRQQVINQSQPKSVDKEKK